MRNILTLCFCFCVLFTLPAFAQKTNTVKSTAIKKAKKVKVVKAKQTELACILPASVHNVDVSQKEVVFCPASNASCLNNTIIEIRTSANDSGNGETNYVYTITAGKIIGSGAWVKWDLSGVPPGIYTITAAVADGSGKVYGTTKTETVKVTECADCK